MRCPRCGGAGMIYSSGELWGDHECDVCEDGWLSLIDYIKVMFNRLVYGWWYKLG